MPSCFSFLASARTVLAHALVLVKCSHTRAEAAPFQILSTACKGVHSVPLFLSPLCCLHWLFALLKSPVVAAMIAQVDCVNTSWNLNPSELHFLSQKLQGPLWVIFDHNTGGPREVTRTTQSDSRNHAAVARPALSSTIGAINDQSNENLVFILMMLIKVYSDVAHS